MLQTGTLAPDFELPDQNGQVHKLSDYRGQKVILYFYSKDMTSGCTKQACGFAERYPLIREKGAVILGVSKDPVATHKRFEQKYGLPFPLLADTELAVREAYDALTSRTTYLIDEAGVITKAMNKVKAADNPEEMLQLL